MAFTKKQRARRGSNESWCQQLRGWGTLFPVCYSNLARVWHLHSYTNTITKEICARRVKAAMTQHWPQAPSTAVWWELDLKWIWTRRWRPQWWGRVDSWRLLPRGEKALGHTSPEGLSHRCTLTPMAGSPRSGSSSPRSYRWEALFPANPPPGTLKRNICLTAVLCWRNEYLQVCR